MNEKEYEILKKEEEKLSAKLGEYKRLKVAKESLDDMLKVINGTENFVIFLNFEDWREPISIDLHWKSESHGQSLYSKEQLIILIEYMKNILIGNMENIKIEK